MQIKNHVSSQNAKAAGNEDYIVIPRKGPDIINSVERGDSIIVAAETKVHKTCRLNYTNKRDIERHKKKLSKILLQP